MEAALVSAATRALKPVLEKLGALVGDKYKRFKGVRDDIKSLTRELTAMEAFLLKMSEEEDPDFQDKVWMNEVRELSYDMEDSIDDFMQSVNDGDTKPDGFLEKMKNSLGKMKARRRIGNEIEDLKKQMIEWRRGMKGTRPVRLSPRPRIQPLTLEPLLSFSMLPNLSELMNPRLR
ncbi:unnamed protein product [Triticum turgidum subsp. durum]|uniref:Disease resistance N-terminal domain-containing protein n=1 Tax=Triticum turgidum subsp. durum TaxID=4567 RepID=A0A9R0YAE1_TRITD|nr:unnamed protein product [Triticum turgidum subsp. durum]